jgi:hypothetical protein
MASYGNAGYVKMKKERLTIRTHLKIGCLSKDFHSRKQSGSVILFKLKKDFGLILALGQEPE